MIINHRAPVTGSSVGKGNKKALVPTKEFIHEKSEKFIVCYPA